MTKPEVKALLALLDKMFAMYKSDFGEFEQEIYLGALTPYPYSAVKSAIVKAVQNRSFLPKPVEITGIIIADNPELDPKRKDAALAEKAMQEIRRFVKTVDSGADYVFEDYKLCLAIKHQYGSLATVGASREDDQAMITKLMYSYKDVCKSFLSHKIDQDHQLVGIYGGRDPRIIYFGNFDECDKIARRLYGPKARFPSKRLPPPRRPLLEQKPMPQWQQQAMLEHVIEELRRMTKPRYE